MRSLDTIVDEVIELFEGELGAVYKANIKRVFGDMLMDIPLNVPTIAVGVENAVINASPLSTFSGTTTLGDIYSAPVKLLLSTNIYLPAHLDGRVGFNFVGLITKLLQESDIPVGVITCEKIRYDKTFMCCVLPMTVAINDRIC